MADNLFGPERHYHRFLRAGLEHLDIKWIRHHDVFMGNVRTTLTLDPDVAKKLRKEQHRTRRTFKEIVNETLRNGLSLGEKPPKRKKRFRVRACHCGLRPGIDPERFNQLIDQLQADSFSAELTDPDRGDA